MTTDVLDELPDLRRAVDGACQAATSEARCRQIRAHARELIRALHHPDHPHTVDDDLADILGRDSLQEYERLALAGQLRARGGVRPTTEATALIRSGVMALLQAQLGLPVIHLRALEVIPGKEPVDVARREQLRASLQTVADRIGRRTHWTVDGGLLAPDISSRVRMLAMAAVVLDTGARVGELCALRLEDLSPALEEVRIVRRPQRARPGSPVTVEACPLRRSTQAALQRYLLVRRLLMTAVTGGADALWVSVRANHGGAGGGDGTRPPGTPLRPRGAARAYTATVEATNIALAGTEGWTPLPTRMEQLRRGVDVDSRYVPQRPESDFTNLSLARLDQAARALAALPDLRSSTSAGRAARDRARHALLQAWRGGVRHQVQLGALADAGLLAYDIPRTGWDPELLRALDRAASPAP